MKTILTLFFACVVATTAMADLFKVNYTTVAGSGRQVTIHANSSYEARRTVQDMFPGAVVTNVSRVKR